MAPITSTRQVAFSALMSRVQSVRPITERAALGCKLADSHNERLTLGKRATNSSHGAAAQAWLDSQKNKPNADK